MADNFIHMGGKYFIYQVSVGYYREANPSYVLSQLVSHDQFRFRGDKLEIQWKYNGYWYEANPAYVLSLLNYTTEIPKTLGDPVVSKPDALVTLERIITKLREALA